MSKVLADAVALFEHLLQGVEITVAFGSYLKSLRMRRIKSAAPAKISPPGGKLTDA